LSLLNSINSMIRSGSCESAAVNRSGESLITDLEAILSAMWADCPESSKDLFRSIREARGIDVATASPSDVFALLDRGFAKKDGGKLVSSCRFLERHLDNSTSDLGTLARLFTSHEAFLENARSLLERRLSHIKRIDPSLKRFIERGIEDIPDNPE